jgi:DNA-binding NarL/FixJ family response regulator
MAPIRNDPVNLGDFLRMGAVGPSSFATAGSDDMTTVLVCELSEINAAGLGAVLKSAACEVVRHCRSGDEMLRMAGLLRPEIIIAGGGTLGDEAIATFRKLQADNPRPRIILLVETDPGSTAGDLAEFNVDGLLMRDASAATLLECVKSVQEGRPWLDPDLLHYLACPKSTMATTDTLTPRERQIMHLVALGMSNKEIAHQATLCEGTVKMHLHHILVKLGLANRTQLATFAHSRSQQPSAWHSQIEKYERPSAARGLQ